MMKIDKSALRFGTKGKVEDRKYLDSYKHRTCEASSDGINLCGLPGVAAHIRTGEYAGMGTKPGDDLTVCLCHNHHMDQESQPGSVWWIENVFKPQCRRKYRTWKKQHGSL